MRFQVFWVGNKLGLLVNHTKILVTLKRTQNVCLLASFLMLLTELLSIQAQLRWQTMSVSIQLSF